jgi:hypothetical protein
MLFLVLILATLGGLFQLPHCLVPEALAYPQQGVAIVQFSTSVVKTHADLAMFAQIVAYRF